MRTRNCFLALAAVLLAGASTDVALADVEHGNIQVIQLDPNNNPTSIILTKASGTPGFSVIPETSNRGDYVVAFGTENDFLSGILLTAVRQNGRDNALPPNSGGYPGQVGLAFATSSISLNNTSNLLASTGYFVPLHQAPDGDEINMDVAVAHFKYADGWLGGVALNLNDTGGFANNSTLNAFAGAASIQMNVHFFDPPETVGIYELIHPQIDSRTGVLIVNGAKNEDNYALSRANADGTFTIICKDNGTNGSSYENDPVAFVYIPATAVNLTAGRVDTDGTLLLTINGGTGAPTVTKIGVGRHRLTIAGQSPATGTLLISPEGGRGENVDNIVTYEADGDGWIIETRDLPAEPPTLQDPRFTDENGNRLPVPIFSFVFLPNSGQVFPYPQGFTVSGRVSVVDAPGSPANRPLDLTFTPLGGGTPIQQTVTPGVDGSFTSRPVPAGLYRLRARFARTLSFAADVDLTGGNLSGLQVALRAGDANDDNAVDVFDLAELVSAFDSFPGAPNWNNGSADFNYDDSVDVLDLDILVRNFDAFGDE
ncbi:MAG: hypothetical protein RMJ43_04670 [Chloroherpetonaceae bacterium]|nr:hypothetical protein [Chthonomonadaceae bacterium]MDW8207107.1 hypothetical protein [Chloroherpetonaceae bacterium]